MNKFTQLISLALIKYADEVTVRDYDSYRYLLDNKVDAKLYKDNSFLMNLDNSNKILNIPKYKKNIGLAVKKPSNDKEATKLLNELTKFILENKNANYWLYALDTHPNYENDETYGKRLINNVLNKTKNKTIFIRPIPSTWSPNKLFSSFKEMDFIIAMRFHAIVFAHRVEAPFVGISYDIKCSSFIESINKKVYKIGDITCKVLEYEMKGINT